MFPPCLWIDTGWLEQIHGDGFSDQLRSRVLPARQTLGIAREVALDGLSEHIVSARVVTLASALVKKNEISGGKQRD